MQKFEKYISNLFKLKGEQARCDFRNTNQICNFCDFLIFNKNKVIFFEVKNHKNFSWRNYKIKQTKQYNTVKKLPNSYLILSEETSNFKFCKLFKIRQKKLIWSGRCVELPKFVLTSLVFNIKK